MWQAARPRDLTNFFDSVKSNAFSNYRRRLNNPNGRRYTVTFIYFVGHIILGYAFVQVDEHVEFRKTPLSPISPAVHKSRTRHIRVRCTANNNDETSFKYLKLANALLRGCARVRACVPQTGRVKYFYGRPVNRFLLDNNERFIIIYVRYTKCYK